MNNNEINNTKECVKALHKVNFDRETGIIKHNNFLIDDFSFNKSYDGNKGKFEEDDIIGYCDECKNFNKPDSNKLSEEEKTTKGNCKLCNISHGSHTFDFLEALNMKPEDELIKGWSEKPVLFLMENPSKDYKIYDYVNNDYDGKRPAKQWYWIHNYYDEEYKRKITETDDFLVMSRYGEMVASLIYKFKLGNAYLTNIVKCGMSDTKYIDGSEKIEENTFLGTYFYQTECIKKCVKKKLTSEISALCMNRKELIVFAFGDDVYWYVKDYFQNCEEFKNLKIAVRLYQLPHPAGRMKNEYRPYVLRGIVDDALSSNKNLINPGIKVDIVKNLLNQLPNKGLKIREGNQSGSSLTYKILENDSIFTDEKYLKELRIRNIKIDNANYGAGYNFNTDEFWAWDYDENILLNFSDFNYNELLESVVIELLTNPTNPNIENININNI